MILCWFRAWRERRERYVMVKREPQSVTAGGENSTFTRQEIDIGGIDDSRTIRRTHD